MKQIRLDNKKIRIRIRDVVIIVILLILFFFCVQSCERQRTDALKEKRIQDHCAIMKINVNDLNALLQRSDLCSEQWFQEFDIYCERLDEQELLLRQEKEETKSSDEAMAEKQAQLRKALKQFKDTPTMAQVTILETEYKAYMNYYHEQCDRGE